MRNAFLELAFKFRDLSCSEEGQDLIEYALLISLITLALVSTMNGIANALVGLFNSAGAAL